MVSDSEDEIFGKSVFDVSTEIIGKGDLVWAPLHLEGNAGNVMWPAQVTSVKKSDKVTVKMLGRPMKAVTVEGCVPYIQNDEYEAKGNDSPYWEEAMITVKKIVDNETHGIIKKKLTSTSEHSTSSLEDGGGPGPSKRRKLRRPKKATVSTGFIKGDIVWAKYRSHPIWPAKVTSVEEGEYLMLEYLEYEDVSIRTAVSKIAHFDCSDYVSNVEAGINSTLSQKFKIAYMNGYQQYRALNPDADLSVSLIAVSCNGHHIEKEPISPHKGKNQLVHFINKNEQMFIKIIQGKLVGQFHQEFKKSKTSTNNGTLFGSFAKTELEEERIITAIGQMQAKFAKRYKLPQAYGLSVMLPESIIRLIMRKRQLSYCKAKEAYLADVLKVRRKDKLSARDALLNTQFSKEVKEEFEELTQLKMQKTLESLESFRGKGKRKRRLL